MKLHFTILKLTVLLCVAFPAHINSQPSNFTYQGVLTESSAPATGVYDFLFVIYNGPDFDYPGISALQSSEVMDVSVSNGLFNADIPFQGWVFNGEQRWLEVQVRTNGAGSYTGLLPWTEITPTPYAVRALNVSSNALMGDYGEMVSFSNASNFFAGDGSGLTGVTLGGATAADFWKLGGNAGTTAGSDFIGTTDFQPLYFKVNNEVGLRLEYAPSIYYPSVNVIGGWPGNNVDSDTKGGTVAGGGSVGYPNIIEVEANFSTISGGAKNVIASNSWYSTIGGGDFNDIGVSSQDSTIGGGYDNNIGGGSDTATIAGGYQNVIGADADWSTIGGGFTNTIQSNAVSSVVGGGWQNAIQTGATNATIAGGRLNSIAELAWDSSIGGGRDNFIQDGSFGSTISGGINNHIYDGVTYGTVGGGFNNEALGSAENPSLSGGAYNKIGIGANFATIPGGRENQADGSFSLAAGYKAKALHGGSFVWADATGTDFSSTGPNQFLIRASGGAGIGTAAPVAPLHVTGGSDTSVSGGGHLVLGNTNSINLSMDGNEIMARNNGDYGVLYLNADGGNVTIGSATPDTNYTLRVNGSIAGVGAYNNISDRRYKKDIRPLVHALETVTRLQGVSFDWQREEHPELNFEDGRQLGFIAQDLRQVVPEAVSEGQDGTLRAAYATIIPLLVEAVKEQQREIAGLKRRDVENAELRKELQGIKVLLSNITKKGTQP